MIFPHSAANSGVPPSVNKIRETTSSLGGPGRVAQRNRTRRAIVDAAARLIAAGKSPSAADIAEAAEVSRRTLYMYFPTLEQLLLDATAGALSQHAIDPVVAASDITDPVERIVQLTHAINQHAAETLHLGRSLIRLTVEGDAPLAGGPRRGYRRVQWIEQALAPARKLLTRAEFERLVSALCVLIGWESNIVLQDVRGIQPKDADDVLTFAVCAVVEKALAESSARRATRSAASPLQNQKKSQKPRLKSR